MVIPLRDNAPGHDWPVINTALIGICVLVFLAQLAYPGGFEASLLAWGEVPQRIHAGGTVPGTNIPAWVTLLSSIFMHGDIFHILSNMYALWLFGDNIEYLMGRWKYLLFYLSCGLLANVVTVTIGAQSDMPGIGASGAIAGVMGAYLLIFPRAKITSFMFISPLSVGHAMTGDWGFQMRNISAFWFIGSWVVMQLIYSGFAIGAEVWLNLGIYAHAAGALTGLALAYPLAIRERLPAADHHTRSDGLTMVMYGDEGDGGRQYEPVNTLSAEAERLRGIPQRLRHLKSSFSDAVAEDLIASGELDAALRHCQEMRQIAQQRWDDVRSRGYDELIARIESSRAARPAQGSRQPSRLR